MSHDQKITKAEVRQMRGSLLCEVAVELFAQEPELVEMMAETWERIDKIMSASPLSPEQQKLLSLRITEHTMKPLILLDRAHRKLWADLLP